MPSWASAVGLPPGADDGRQERTGVMKHYIVICEYCVCGECGVDIIGVRHTEEEALALYNEQLPIERKCAEENGYDVTEETEKYFVACEDSNYCDEHINLYIEKSER